MCCSERVEKLKKWFLKFLDDPDIKQKIRNISEAGEEENNEEYQKKIEELQAELDGANANCKRLQENLNHLREEDQRQLESLQEKNRVLKEQYEKILTFHQEEHEKNLEIQRSFRSFENAYQAYQALSERTRNGLAGIFRGESLIAFMICGVQPDNILSLWDFCKTEFNQGHLEDRENLVGIFRCFLDETNQVVYASPRYELQPVTAGERFDTEQCSASSDSPAVGVIEGILLPGLCYASNHRIVRKSLVKVR